MEIPGFSISDTRLLRDEDDQMHVLEEQLTQT